MLPVLFRIGPVEIRAFGVLVAISFLVGVWMARVRALGAGIEPKRIVDLTFWTLPFGLLGARVLYIAQEWAYYRENLDQLVSLQIEGFTSFGAILGGLLVLWIWCWRNGISSWRVLDIMGVPFLVASAIGRVGCFLNGCCYGVACDLPIGVHVHGLPDARHPAQLYEMGLLLVAAWLVTRRERRGLPVGASFGLAFVGFGASRYIYEIFRAGSYDEVARGVASSTYWGSLPITEAQAVALGIVGIGVLILWQAVRGRFERAA